MESPKWLEFENRLAKMYKHRAKTARRQRLDCYRIYDNDLPSFPFVIEMYGDYVYVSEYNRRHGMEDDEHELWLEDSVDAIAKVLEKDVDNIFVRERKRMSHRSQNQYERIAQNKDFFDVKENGLTFLVNLTDYLDSGLFLDHRITRKMVMEQAAEKSILNLFSYTCSFSVYAAAGKAKEVVSVDLSKTYLNWGEQNFELNDLTNPTKYQFVHADVLQYLKELPQNRFDIIVMDPPTFSNSKRMKDILDIQRDHVELINDALAALKPNGKLYFSTNYRKFQLEKEAINSEKIKDITKATTPFDFENKLFRWCYLIEK